MLGQTVGFLFGNLYDGTMLGRDEIGRFHPAFVKLSEVLEMNKIGRFAETEIMHTLTVAIVHQHPFLFTDTFSYIGGFASFFLGIVPLGVEFINTVGTIRNGLLDSRLTVMRDVKHPVCITYFGDVGIDGRYLFIRVLEQQLRLFPQP